MSINTSLLAFLDFKPIFISEDVQWNLLTKISDLITF